MAEAVAAGDATRVRQLVEEGADFESPLAFGMTPLMGAANRDHTEVMEVLLDTGASVDGEGLDGLTPVHLAARADATEALTLLLDRGADPSVRSTSGMNALDHAAAAGSVGAIALLVARTDLDIDEPSGAITQGHGYPRDDGPTPLGLAVREGRLEAVGELLELGAAVDAPSASGHTPLLLAIFFDQPPEVVELLLNAGASPEAEARCVRGCSIGDGKPLTVGEWASALDRVEVASILQPDRPR